MNNCNQVPHREVVASICISRLDGLAARLEQLQERVHGKLNPVMAPEAPATIGSCASAPEEIYPSYFEQMRGLCKHIERSISSIEYALDRVEL